MNGDDDVDKMFGMRHENDNFINGDKVVQIQGDNIHRYTQIIVFGHQ